MIKFGTLKNVDKEDIKISVAKLESSSYKDGKKTSTNNNYGNRI